MSINTAQKIDVRFLLQVVMIRIIMYKKIHTKKKFTFNKLFLFSLIFFPHLQNPNKKISRLVLKNINSQFYYRSYCILSIQMGFVFIHFRMIKKTFD